MRTLIFKLNISSESKEIIKSLQNDYSISFRKMYNNLEIMKDPTFISSLKIKSKKQIEYLQKEVEAFQERNLANKEKIKQNIFKLESKDNLREAQFKHLQYLKKSLNNKVCFGGRGQLIKLSKGTGDLDKWKNSRLLPLVFYGETSRNGNRFFNFNGLSDGKILFKLESTNIKIDLSFNPKKHLDVLRKLESMALSKKISITIKLNFDMLYITYDESILNDTNIDIKAFYKTISHIKDKTERKRLIANRHKEHENKLKKGKLDRYLAIDLNPDGIGYVITENDGKLITRGFLDVSRNIESNKRKYETSIMLKYLFGLIRHYRCHSIIVEELSLNNTDLGNKVSNRKVNNLWNRVLIDQIINRKCNEEGIKRIDINPAYSSFIGNIMYDMYDPIAAAMEICRRGRYKYNKGSFYPELCKSDFINDWRYGEIERCVTWKDMYDLFIHSGWSYRRKDKSFLANLFSKNSNILIYN